MTREDAHQYLNLYAAFTAARTGVKILDIDLVQEMIEIQVPGPTPADGVVRLWADYWTAAKCIEANSSEPVLCDS